MPGEAFPPGEAVPSSGTPVRAGGDDAASPAPGRFGARLAGLPVLFPAGEMLEYLPEVTVWRMPLAPLRVAGLMQLRGHPIPVFDADRGRADEAPARVAVLLVGDAPRAAALVVESAPRGVELAGGGPGAVDAPRGASESGAVPPERDADADAGTDLEDLDEALDAIASSVCFAGALGAPLRDRSGQRWWPVSPALLFEALAGEARDD